MTNNPNEEPNVDDVILVLQFFWRLTTHDIKNAQADIGRQVFFGRILGRRDIKAVKLS